MNQTHNNDINSDAKKLRCAALFAAGYGWRYAPKAISTAILKGKA
jgi:hypothetical protein